jgi:sensor histidine kinase regulating citrate/malate metabolism
MIAILFTLIALGMIALFLLFLACVPLYFAHRYTQQELQQQQVKDALTIARTQKVRRDLEVLESRQALIDSDVAIRELKIEKMRRDSGDYTPFDIINY